MTPHAPKEGGIGVDQDLALALYDGFFCTRTSGVSQWAFLVRLKSQYEPRPILTKRTTAAVAMTATSTQIPTIMPVQRAELGVSIEDT